MRRMQKVAVAVLLTGVFAGVGCGLAAKREAAMKTKSKSNLKQIDQALQMFAAMNNAFPKTLEEMIADSSLSENALKSPTKEGKKGYGYVAGLKPDGDINIVAFDLKHNFEGGRFVLATNSDIAWMIEDRFQEGLQRTLKNAKDSGLTVKVIE